MTVKKLIGKIHLWLGLCSGLVILILGITGCILAFELEIRDCTEPFRKINIENKNFLPPTELKKIADTHLRFGKTLSIEYPGVGKAAIGSYYDATHYEVVFINPYSGKVLRHKNMTKDFFRIILEGHFYLWLPHYIGQPLVASATLLFIIMMISGLILWWPKSRVAARQRFSVKWSARWRRRNYDLHNVLGFYMTWVAIFIAVTGLVMGFQWFAKSVYWVTSGGQKMIIAPEPVSDTTCLSSVNVTDYLCQQQLQKIESKESLSVYFAATATAPLELIINHRPGTYYNCDIYHYDQYSGKELPASGTYSGKFSDANTADKIARMNYDMHVGAILGICGKILVFFASLIASSLPVTGFLIWLGRRKKNNSSFV